MLALAFGLLHQERRACSVDEIDSAANEQDVLLSRLTLAYDIELVMDVLDRAEE